MADRLESEQIARDIIKHLLGSRVLVSPTASVGLSNEELEEIPPPCLDIPYIETGSCASDSYSQSEWLQADDLPEDNKSSELLCLDSEFVKKHLGVPLSLALTEILTKRPADPIHYLAHWLLKWRWNQEQKQLQEDKVLALIAERKRIADEIEENLRRKEELQREALQQLHEEAELIAKEQLELMFQNMQLKELTPEGAGDEVPGEQQEPTNLDEEIRASDENSVIVDEDD